MGGAPVSRSVGTWGEALVANYLRDRGYELLAAGYRCRFGEIDLIARKKGVLCFVEVKLRSGTEHGLPREFVTQSKQQKLRRTAEAYLSANDLFDAPSRFDVAEVYADAERSEKSRIVYLENAF